MCVHIYLLIENPNLIHQWLASMAIILYWYVCVISRFQDFFFSALLRYNWHITLCKFKAYRTLIWFMYLHWKMITAIALANISITPHNYHFFLCFCFCFFFSVRIFSIYFNFPGGSDGKPSVYNAGDPGSSPGLGQSPGEGNGNPLQYYCWKIPWMEEPDRLVYGVAKSRTWLSDFTSLSRLYLLCGLVQVSYVHVHSLWVGQKCMNILELLQSP